jgi:hypothetical protein
LLKWIKSSLEHDELQLKEDDWIDGGPSTSRVVRLDEIADKGQVEELLKVTVEVVSRYY